MVRKKDLSPKTEDYFIAFLYHRKPGVIDLIKEMFFLQTSTNYIFFKQNLKDAVYIFFKKVLPTRNQIDIPLSLLKWSYILTGFSIRLNFSYAVLRKAYMTQIQ